INSHHHKHSNNQCERQIAFRFFYLAGEERYVVPTIIGPKRTQHRSRKSRKPATGDGHRFASATVVRLREMSPVTSAVEERAETNRDKNQHFEGSQNSGDAAADANGCAID